jgi:predicted permease
MGWIKNLRSGLQSLLGKRRVEREIDEELDGYLDAAAAHKQQLGMSAREARRAARVEMGGRNAVKQRVWSSRWESVVENLLQDLRLGVRGLAKSPGFTVVALLSLTLGIGANTAIFTLMNAIMLRPLPVDHPQQLVLFGNGASIGSIGGLPHRSWQLFSYAMYRRFREKTEAFSTLTAVSSVKYGPHASIDGKALEQVQVDLVAGNYFSLLGVRPALGRVIGEADDQAPGSNPVAVAGYAWFRRHFGSDVTAIGKPIDIEGHVYTLIGVAQPGFFGTTVGESADFWIPLSMEKEISPGWNGIDDKFFQSLFLIGRLKPSVSYEQASVGTNVLFKQILRSEYVGANPSKKELDSIQHASIDLTSAANGLSQLRFQFSEPLTILMVIVGLVLLIACGNIANMLMARGVSRAREVAVRMALGASRARIVLQLLTESSLLALTGAALGVALAWRASPLLLRMAAPGPRAVPVDLSPDLPVLGFTLAVTVLTALLFGILPALRATRLELTPALKEGRGGGTASTRSTLARGLIVGQIALSVLLLAAAGLFLRSLLNLNSIDTGFDKHNVIVFSTDENAAHLKEDAQLVQTQQQIEARVQAIPNVKAESFAGFTFEQGQDSDGVIVPGAARTSENSHDVLFNVTGDGFFATLGLPVLNGRGFNSHDTETTPHVAVINQSMERLFFPHESAIGHHFGIGDDPAHGQDFEIVGVVKDAKLVHLAERQRMAAYFPYSQRIQFFSNFAVRYSGDKQPVIVAVRQAIAQINPNILISDVTTLEEKVDGSIATQSLIAQLSAFFGVLAVFLACIGIYGLMSYAVLRRTNEIGIRLALGAQSRALLWMILRESMVLLMLGLAVGLPITLGSTGILRTLLYQLSPVDPVVLSGAVLVVAAMTVAAAWLPARRATRVDPMVALRCD